MISPDDTFNLIVRRHAGLLSERLPWLPLWDELSTYCMPRRAGILSKVTSPDTTREARLYDITAVQANQTLAAGLMAWMTPARSPWFAFEPDLAQEDDDEIKRWLQDCTRRAAHYLALSNFYTEAHECYLDRGTFGTSTIKAESGKSSPLHFQCIPVNMVCIAEDDEGKIDTAFREMTITARQAMQWFGKGNSPKVTNAANGSGDKPLEKFRFLHAVYPREDAERDHLKIDGPNMPIASVYLDLDNKHMVQVGGFKEMPLISSRYLHWSGGLMDGSVYGWAPSWVALPEARQLNFLQKMMDALAEVAAFPRLLVPATFEGEFDLKAYGQTHFQPGLDGKPEAWLTEGRYDIGLNRVQERQKAIERAFHVDLFQMFSSMEKPGQMTATEVIERSSEKLIQISPAFSRMISELFNPLLRRVFAILLRGGWFMPPPRSAIVGISPDGLRGDIPDPKITYTSKLALALRAEESLGFMRHMEGVLSISQVNPGVLDNYDFDAASRDMAMTAGLSPKWLRPIADVEALRDQRAQMMAQQQQMAQAQQAAETAGKLGQIKSDSPVGQAMGSMGGGMMGA